MPRPALPLAFAACLPLIHAPARAQTPDLPTEPWASPAPCAEAPADAAIEDLARRFHLCARHAAMQAAHIAALERAIAGLDAAALLPPPVGEVSRGTNPGTERNP